MVGLANIFGGIDFIRYSRMAVETDNDLRNRDEFKLISWKVEYTPEQSYVYSSEARAPFITCYPVVRELW